MVIWLSFDFLQFSSVKSCPANHLRPEKIGVIKAVSSLFAILYFLPPQIWPDEFICQWAPARAQICLMV